MYLCLAELRRDGSDEKRQFDYDESPASRGFCFPAIRQGYSRGALHQYPCHIVEDQSLAPAKSWAICCENGRLVGVVAPSQPSAHAFRSQANQGPLL